MFYGFSNRIENSNCIIKTWLKNLELIFIFSIAGLKVLYSEMGDWLKAVWIDRSALKGESRKASASARAVSFSASLYNCWQLETQLPQLYEVKEKMQIKLCVLLEIKFLNTNNYELLKRALTGWDIWAEFF